MITVIYGNGHTGKTHNAEALRNFYKAKRIVDGWSPGDDRVLQRGDLVLTNVARSTAIKGIGKPHGGFRIFHIGDALRDARLQGPPNARQLIEAERKRQVEAEGYDKRHDDLHDTGELMSAGELYLASAKAALGIGPAVKLRPDGSPAGWPWEKHHWKPKGARREVAHDCTKNVGRAVAILTAALKRRPAASA